MGESFIAGVCPRSESILNAWATFLPVGKGASLAVGVLGEESGSVAGEDSSSASGEKGCCDVAWFGARDVAPESVPVRTVEERVGDADLG